MYYPHVDVMCLKHVNKMQDFIMNERCSSYLYVFQAYIDTWYFIKNTKFYEKLNLAWLLMSNCDPRSLWWTFNFY